MRLQLAFKCNNLKVPFNYQHMIQGLIYSAFDKEDKGDFFHNQGYRFEKKVFKMFVFSNLFGKYKINDRFIQLVSIKFMKLEYFTGEKQIVIHTLSPIVTYTTTDHYVDYFKPSDAEFNTLCMNNLLDKCHALDIKQDAISFNVEKVMCEKKRLVKFKNTFYVGYLSEMIVKTNFETLSLLYDTGISAKGPAGFGMIEVKKSEESSLSV